MSLEWDVSSSHWNDRDGLGMTGLDQERRNEEVSQEVIPVSIPAILAPSHHSAIIRKYENNGDDPGMRVEWDQAQGLSWQLSLYRNILSPGRLRHCTSESPKELVPSKTLSETSSVS